MNKLTKKILVVAKAKTITEASMNISMKMEPIKIVDLSPIYEEDRPVKLKKGETLTGFITHVTYDFDNMTAKLSTPELTGFGSVEWMPIQYEESTDKPITDTNIKVVNPPPNHLAGDTLRNGLVKLPEKPRELSPNAQVFPVLQPEEKKIVVTGIPGTAQPPIPKDIPEKIPGAKRRAKGKYCALDCQGNVLMEMANEVGIMAFTRLRRDVHEVRDPDDYVVWPKSK